MRRRALKDEREMEGKPRESEGKPSLDFPHDVSLFIAGASACSGLPCPSGSYGNAGIELCAQISDAKFNQILARTPP